MTLTRSADEQVREAVERLGRMRWYSLIARSTRELEEIEGDVATVLAALRDVREERDALKARSTRQAERIDSYERLTGHKYTGSIE